MIPEESTLQCSVTKMDVVHLLFGQVHLKCYIMENTFPLVIQTLKLERVQLTCTAKWTVQYTKVIIYYGRYIINFHRISGHTVANIWVQNISIGWFADSQKQRHLF